MPIDTTRALEADPPPLVQIDPKRRKCLRCGDAFESQWAGERICVKCKRSSTWRSGQPNPLTPEKIRG
jgi:hypothetical protein